MSQEESSAVPKEDQLFHFSKDQGGTTLCEICSEVEGAPEGGGGSTTEHPAAGGKSHGAGGGSTTGHHGLETTTEKVGGNANGPGAGSESGKGGNKESGKQHGKAEGKSASVVPQKKGEQGSTTASGKEKESAGHTKPKVVVVNNSGEKLNNTVLENLLKEPVSDVNLEYIDVKNTSNATGTQNEKSESESNAPDSPTVSCELSKHIFIGL